jgi:hypothetical protein
MSGHFDRGDKSGHKAKQNVCRAQRMWMLPTSVCYVRPQRTELVACGWSHHRRNCNLFFSVSFASNNGEEPMRLHYLSTVVVLAAIAVLTAAKADSAQSQFLMFAASDQIQLAQQTAPQPQPLAPPKPYAAISITLPASANDPSFDAFRKQLADVASHKDRAGLGKLVVAQGFFWEGESGDKADSKKASVDNLAAATGLDSTDGWDAIAAAAQEPTLEPYTDRKGVSCGPASPQYDEKALEDATKATQTDMSEWGFPSKAGLEVRSAAQPNASVVEKLGLTLIRVMPEPTAPGTVPGPFLRIVTPAGKVGYVPADTISPLTSDQICYVKDGNNWKIAGYIGG